MFGGTTVDDAIYTRFTTHLQFTWVFLDALAHSRRQCTTAYIDLALQNATLELCRTRKGSVVFSMKEEGPGALPPPASISRLVLWSKPRHVVRGLYILVGDSNRETRVIW